MLPNLLCCFVFIHTHTYTFRITKHSTKQTGFTKFNMCLAFALNCLLICSCQVIMSAGGKRKFLIHKILIIYFLLQKIEKESERIAALFKFNTILSLYPEWVTGSSQRILLFLFSSFSLLFLLNAVFFFWGFFLSIVWSASFLVLNGSSKRKKKS